MATEIAEHIRQIRGVQDVHLHQVMNVPKLHVDVDQTRARELGLTQQDVANSLLVSLSGSGQVQPNYWVDPEDGDFVSRRNADADLQAGQRRRDQRPAADFAAESRACSCCRTSPRSSGASRPRSANHTNVQPTFDVYANVQGRDLGSVASEINQVLDRVSGQTRAGQHDHDARPGGEHGIGVPATGAGAGLCRGAGLLADGRQFSELARSVHHHHGACPGRLSASSGRCSCGRRRSACRP